jgi:hypothetical protein
MKKKLIEVVLPLGAINAESARKKSVHVKYSPDTLPWRGLIIKRPQAPPAAGCRWRPSDKDLFLAFRAHLIPILNQTGLDFVSAFSFDQPGQARSGQKKAGGEKIAAIPFLNANLI